MVNPYYSLPVLSILAGRDRESVKYCPLPFYLSPRLQHTLTIQAACTPKSKSRHKRTCPLEIPAKLQCINLTIYYSSMHGYNRK